MAGENMTGSSGIGASGTGPDDVSRGGAGGGADVSRGGADGLSRSAGSSVSGTSGVAGTDMYRDTGTDPYREEAPRHAVKAAAHELKDRAREGSRDLLDQAVEKKDELKARASTAVDDGRHRAADRVGTLARALHDTADNLGSQGDEQLSGWVHQAADQVERVVGYLNGHDAGGLMRDMEDVARRNPALFLGGTYAAGLVLGRFLRASSPERRSERSLPDDAPGADDRYRTLASTAEESRAGATLAPTEVRSRPEDMTSDGSWTGVGVSPDSFAGGHTSGGRSDRLESGDLTRYTNGDVDREV